jgi:hypothetical protein
MSRWSFAEQRRLIEIAASSSSLEELAKRAKKPLSSIRKIAPQLGISLKFNSANRRSASGLKTKSKA